MAGLATALRIAPHSSLRIALVTKDVPPRIDTLSARPRGRRIAVDRAGATEERPVWVFANTDAARAWYADLLRDAPPAEPGICRDAPSVSATARAATAMAMAMALGLLRSALACVP
jgi:hypothetical protein